jgi:protein-histidine pros-kinase
LIESNIDALMTTDPLGIITDVNQQMKTLTGYTRDELIGSPFKQYFTDPARAEKGILTVLREGRVTDYDLTARAKGGQETVVSYNATTFYDQEGKLQGVFAAARDVTERKRFEQALQEKNLELENANLAKDRFLASMSHELRTPLTAIIGFTGILLMEMPGPLTADQQKQLDTIQSSAKHLLSLINDLLDLAKIESGKVEINLERVICQKVLQEVEGALRPLAEQKGLRFVGQFPERQLVVRTDRRALHQIVLNLCNNAIKFTEHGEVRLALGSRAIKGKRFAEISIEDTGVGIKKEDQARLFQAFEQVGGKRHTEGTGLGLYLSQKLAALAGGTIEFRSEFGEGSRFALIVPED